MSEVYSQRNYDLLDIMFFFESATTVCAYEG